MRVLVVGNGGREHALVWAAVRAGAVVWATRPNPGMAPLCSALDLSATDIDGVVAAACALAIDLVLIGPEAPLVAGLADALRAAGVTVLGPGRSAARLEASKAFAKDFLARHGIPTARHRTCHTVSESMAFLAEFGAPVVVKADGLAAGKGVVVAETERDARAAIEAFQQRRHLGDAGATLVLEERLQGPEVSALALCDGERLVAFDLCRDHKRLGDGDTGPNTGGMGAVCPVPGVAREVHAAILQDVLLATVAGLRRDGLDYRGVLYAGVMLTPDGPKVLEYNVRFGDPEAQVLLPRLGRAFLPAAWQAARGCLAGPIEPEDARPAVAVVVAAPGYPSGPTAGAVVSGIAAAEAGGTLVFQAGTAQCGAHVVASGGRVLAVTALGSTFSAAIVRAYEGVACIGLAGGQFRRDIGATTTDPARPLPAQDSPTDAP
ncbi:MAG: phosphoribosylamine--glycine ligase [Myxococcales bacterium]|nr:phosphoribosylamine--glycine ligase [Myxococcales bacterium]